MKNLKNFFMMAVATIMAMGGVFSSCSAEDGWAPEIEKVVNNYLPYEVQIWQPTPHTTLLSDTLNTVEGEKKEWSMTYSFELAQAVIILSADQQGKPEIVSSDDKGNAILSDGQEVVGEVVVNNAGILSTIENAKLVVTNISAERRNIGEANATLITVVGKLSADVRLTSTGETERFETTVKKTYIQAEVPVKVQVETVVETITDSVYVEIEKIVYVPVEVEVHDTTTVVVHDTITVTNTVVVRDTVIVTETVNNYIEIHDTTYVDKYVYLNSLNKSIKDKFGYSEALLKMGDAEVLKLLVTLDKRVIEVPEAQLYTATLTGNNNASANFDDSQIANLTVIENGAIVENVSWGVSFENSPIHDGVAYGEVVCVVEGYTFNERGEKLTFSVEMTPGYLHFVKTPEPTIVEPEVVSYSVSVNFTLGEDKLTGEYTITGSDGYSAVLTQVIAQWGLCKNVDTKWVKDSKSTRSDDVTESTKSKDLTRDGKVWSYDKVTRRAINRLSWVATSDSLVSGEQNIALILMSLTHVLPNGESVVIALDGNTIYSNEEKNEGKKIDYCEEEQAPAEYCYTQYQGVKHYISGTISINGEVSEINFSNFGLEKDSEGYVLGGNTINFDVAKVLK